MRVEVQHELIRRFRRALDDPDAELAPAPLRCSNRNFTDPRHLAEERVTLFRSRPLVAALSADVAEPGSFLVTELDGVPVLVARDEEGRTRVFRNACRHRGVAVAKGRGSVRQVFTCPFHAWSYRLDGSLHRQPAASGCFDLDGEDFALAELPSDEAAGLILARLDGQRFDARETLGGLVDDLETLNVAGHHHVDTRVQERSCNWKLVLDTFIEAYHVPFLHKQTIASLYHARPALFDGLGDHLRFVPIRRSLDTIRDDGADGGLVPHATTHYLIFPNTLVVHQLDHIETWRVFPITDDPGRSWIETSVYAPPGPIDDKARAHWIRNLDYLLKVTDNEDFPQAEAAQRNMNGDPHGSVVYGRNEPCLVHFHQRLATAMESPSRMRPAELSLRRS